MGTAGLPTSAREATAADQGRDLGRNGLHAGTRALPWRGGRRGAGGCQGRRRQLAGDERQGWCRRSSHGRRKRRWPLWCRRRRRFPCRRPGRPPAWNRHSSRRPCRQRCWRCDRCQGKWQNREQWPRRRWCGLSPPPAARITRARPSALPEPPVRAGRAERVFPVGYRKMTSPFPPGPQSTADVPARRAANERPACPLRG